MQGATAQHARFEMPRLCSLVRVDEMSEEEAALHALNEEVQRDIARLHRLILDASERAARTINPGT